MTSSLPISQPSIVGQQRTWMWRGWKVRYTHLRSKSAVNHENNERDDAPILWLHGFGSSLQQWRYNLDPISARHTVYAMDFLGFGGSEKAAVSYGVDLWVAQVRDFWQTWIQRPIVLVGHSLGALVALRVATLYPDMVERLVLVTLPAARQELLPGFANTLAMSMERLFASPLLLKPLFQVLRRPPVIRRVLQSVYHRREAVTDEVIELFCTPPTDRGAARAFCYLAKSRTNPSFSPRTQSLLIHLQVPTLMLWGDRDRVIPISWGRQIAPSNSHIELTEVPDAGHCLYDEHPETVNQLIADWLARSQHH